MAETIDFDTTARRIAELTDLAKVREQLVLVWNARGAVDTATIEMTLSTMGATAAGPYLKNLDRALRGLDR